MTPANPRLVTRVANAFGMLMALQLQLGRRDPEDLVARAAIMFVRFPTLVDQLLSEPDPPAIDPTTAPADNGGTSPWLRPDVQQVLRDQHGTPIDIVTLAGCYGREYAPAVAAPQRPQAAESSPFPQSGGRGWAAP